MGWGMLWIFLISISQIPRNHPFDDYLFSTVNKQTAIPDQLSSYSEKRKGTCSTYPDIAKVVQLLVEQWDSNGFSLNWYVSIAKEDYLDARWHEHNNSLFGRFNAAAPQLADLLFARSFKALILFPTAAAYTPSVAAALEQRDSCLSLPPSPPYPPVLGRSNHKMRKQGSQCSRCLWCHIGGATCSGWSFGLSIEIGTVRGCTSPYT